MYPNQQLKGAQAERGMTVEDVAREASLSVTTVVAIRQGKENIKLASLDAFARAVGLKPVISFQPMTEARG